MRRDGQKAVMVISYGPRHAKAHIYTAGCLLSFIRRPIPRSLLIYLYGHHRLHKFKLLTVGNAETVHSRLLASET